MVPPDTDEGFKVTDRRRRTDDDVPAVSTPPTLPPPPAPEPPRAESPSAPEDAPAPFLADEPGVAGERSLAGLFAMLAGSAAMAMGAAPDPMTGQVHQDLDQAADLVDLLILLREKTEGNRTPEETQILDEVLYDLQLRYVAATKRSSREPGRSRS